MPYLSGWDSGNVILDRNRSCFDQIIDNSILVKPTSPVGNRVCLGIRPISQEKLIRPRKNLGNLEVKNTLQNNKTLPMINEIVNASDIAESKFCVSSDDGRKLYKLIRSALLNKKNVCVSFEGIENLSSAFLDEAIGNLYNGEFMEEELKQRVRYLGLTKEDSRLLENIIQWAKEDFAP